MLVELNKANDFDYMRTTKEWNRLSIDARKLYMVLEAYYKNGATKEDVTAEQLANDAKVDIKDLNTVKKELIKLGLYGWSDGKLVVYTIVPNDHPMVDAFCDYYKQYYGVMHSQIDNPQYYEAIISSRLTADNLKEVAYKVFESKEEPIGIKYFCAGNVIAAALQKIEKPKKKDDLTAIDKQWNEINEKIKAENEWYKQPKQKTVTVSDDGKSDDEKISEVIEAYNKACRGKNHIDKVTDRERILELLSRYSVMDFKNVFLTSWWDFGPIDFDEVIGMFESAMEYAVPCGFVLDEE